MKNKKHRLLSLSTNKILIKSLYLILFLVILASIVVLLYNYYPHNYNYDIKKSDNLEFRKLFLQDKNATKYVYYNFDNISNNVNFESLFIEMEKKYPDASPLGDFIIDDSLQDKIIINNNVSKYKIIRKLINLSFVNPFYLYVNNKVQFSQSYYYIPTSLSLYSNTVPEGTIVRYIFIINSSIIKNKSTDTLADKLVRKYNNLVRYKQYFDDGFYIFILDFPDEIFQKIFYDQGGLR